MLTRFLCLALAVITLSGCAGLHVRPGPDYADERTTPPNTLRVAFDQSGAIYPRDGSVVPWDTVQMRRLNEVTGRNAFLLEKIHVGPDTSNTPYTPAMRAALLQDATRRLNSMLQPGGKLLVLVHGFNENYDDARKNFDIFRNAVGEPLPPTLEVFWDGLIIPDQTFGQAARLWFWPNAVLYSNLAGQHGLRHLLNGIAVPTDVRVLTFSRGAAVALSAVADPIYDAEWGPAPSFSNPQIRSIKLGMVAAAVGSGHLRDEANEQLSRRVELVVGFNCKDFALRKLVAAGKYGDTRLGTNSQYAKEVVQRRWPNLPIKVVPFRHGYEHNLAHYAYANTRDGPLTNAMSCLLGLMDLGAGTCAGVDLME